MEPPTPEAPPAIAVVRDFVNTTDRETGTDDLSDPADLTRYLVGHDLMPRASRASRRGPRRGAAAPGRAAAGARAQPRRGTGRAARAGRGRSRTSRSR